MRRSTGSDLASGIQAYLWAGLCAETLLGPSRTHDDVHHDVRETP